MLEGEILPTVHELYPDLPPRPGYTHGTSIQRALHALVMGGLVVDDRENRLHNYSLTEAGGEKARAILEGERLRLRKWAFLIKCPDWA